LLFFVSAGKWGIGLMTGGLVAYSVAAYEHITSHSVTATVWVGLLGTLLFMIGAFLAWNEQFNKAILAGTPEILIEYEKPPRQIAAPGLFIKSLGGGNAYRLKIRDITNGSALAVFNEVSHLEQKQTCEATATFTNFRVPTPFFRDNFAAFLRTAENSARAMESIEHALSPQIIKVIVDYFSVSDMRFTAEFEIRATYAWEEAHTFLVRRYFNPAGRKRPKS
jgi:hypothetical protein